MAESKVDTVTLISPNGQTVTVAASKKELRLAAGYQLPEKQVPEKRTPPKPGSPTK
jgi:hypothetical protein